MHTTPKSERLQIGIFGRTNVGKSSFLNLIAGQDVAITSPVPGTTTDVVEKVMELLPIGPVVFLDTAGVDDASNLSSSRLARTRGIFDRADIAVLITEPDIYTEYEDGIIREAKARDLPVITVVNKSDTKTPGRDFTKKLESHSLSFFSASSKPPYSGREETVALFKEGLKKVLPKDFIKPLPILSDILPKGGTAVMIIPIDTQAPKGRIILPQVQAIRDALDNDASALVVKESGYAGLLKKLSFKPDIVICDSQVVDKMVADTPGSIKCTTFSIVFSRYKGDLNKYVKGAIAIDSLKPGDRVLISEACSHHPLLDDIGRIKIPKWMKEYLGFDVEIDAVAGRDYPADLSKYKLIVHCGACMITRKEMLNRTGSAEALNVPITNYGVCISHLKGVLGRVLEPFPEAEELIRSYKKGRTCSI